jgi:hypothetical protein
MVERTQPLADTGRMARKPEQPKTWTVYKVAAKAILLGTIEASGKKAAIEAAAKEFKTDTWRLYAVARR